MGAAVYWCVPAALAMSFGLSFQAEVVCDGTDATAGIVSALAADDEVHLSGGVCVLSSTVLVEAGKSLVGHGGVVIEAAGNPGLRVTGGVYGDGRGEIRGVIVKGTAPASYGAVHVEGSGSLRDSKVFADGGTLGVLVKGIHGHVANVYVEDFDIGVKVHSAYYATLEDLHIRRTVANGDTGLLVTAGTNANHLRNVRVLGEYATGARISGGNNTWYGGDLSVIHHAQNDVLLVDGIGNVITAIYVENIDSHGPQWLFRFGPSSAANAVRDVYLVTAGPVSSLVKDEGTGNEVHSRPIGVNYASYASPSPVVNIFPGPSWPWSGDRPAGCHELYGGTATLVATDRGDAVEFVQTSGTARLTCYVSGHAMALDPTDIGRLRGQTMQLSAWVKTTDASNTPLIRIWAVSPSPVWGSANVHSLGGGWELLRAIVRVPVDATAVKVDFLSVGTVLISEPVLMIGAH